VDLDTENPARFRFASDAQQDTSASRRRWRGWQACDSYQRLQCNKKLAEVRNMKPVTGSPVETKTIQILEKVEVDKNWVVANLKSVVERCMEAEEVLDCRGKPTGKYTFNATGANRALELLGKKLGMFVDRGEMKLEINSLDEALAAMPTDVLDREIARLQAEEDAKRARKPN
jgi:hypothetical protein